jgi:hypothetical protein
VIRAVDMARLSVEELQTLEVIARKLSAPLPDAPQNQIESKPCVEAVEVESEAFSPSSRGTVLTSTN